MKRFCKLLADLIDLTEALFVMKKSIGFLEFSFIFINIKNVAVLADKSGRRVLGAAPLRNGL